MWQYAKDLGCVKTGSVLDYTNKTNIHLLKKAETIIVSGAETWCVLTKTMIYADLWRKRKAAFKQAIHHAARGKYYNQRTTNGDRQSVLVYLAF